jgi:hypothetical protein
MRLVLKHDRQRVLAREGIILLGCLLLAAALWSWGTLTTTAVHFPPFQVWMLTPSTNGVLLYGGLAMVRVLVWGLISEVV